MNKELSKEETLEKILDEIEASNPNEVPEWKATWRDGAKKATRVFTKYLDQEKKKEAIALFGFAEWASHSDWTYLPSKKLWYNEEDEENVTPKTTDELYKLFNQQK